MEENASLLSFPSVIVYQQSILLLNYFVVVVDVVLFF
jgi:hypothetical protein